MGRPAAGHGVRRVLIAVAAVAAVLLVVAVAQQRRETTVWTVTQPVARAIVSGDVDEVVVTGSARSDVAVRIRERFLAIRPRVSVDLAAADLRVRAECVWWVQPCGVDVVVSVPRTVGVQVDVGAGSVLVRDTDGSTLVSTGSGDVTVAGLSGEVRVRTGSGDLSLDAVAGPLDVRTGSGDVAGAVLRASRASVEVGDGDVQLSFATAPADVGVRVGAGDVRLLVPGGPYRVDVRSDAGDVQVEVPADAGAEPVLAVATGSGAVSVEPAPPDG